MSEDFKGKLSKIFEFLNENRKYNKNLQSKHFIEILGTYDNTIDRAISMLWNAAYSQSQPNIDNLAAFWKAINRDKIKLNTFSSLIDLLSDIPKNKSDKLNNKSVGNNYEALFNNLKLIDGWGDKTAALFCKEIYLLHNTMLGEEYKIWDDAQCDVLTDKLYLPVDKVIMFIFNKISNRKYKNFRSINSQLHNTYSSTSEILIWDDLWFWGFITQKSKKSNQDTTAKAKEDRELVSWNEEKYWGLRHSPKDTKTINEIKGLAGEFESLLIECGTV